MSSTGRPRPDSRAPFGGTIAIEQTALIVDDSLSTRMFTSRLLASLRPDWDVLVAKDGPDALAKVAGKQVELMLLDINMPGMDGFEPASKLVEMFPNGWITLLSANVQQRVKDRARERGFSFVEKPVSEGKLDAIVQDFESTRG